MESEKNRELVVALSRISGVTVRLCNLRLETRFIAGDEVTFPEFNKLPRSPGECIRAITGQGDFLVTGCFSSQGLERYFVAGPVTTHSWSFAKILVTAVVGNAQSLLLVEDHVKIVDLDVDLAKKDSDDDAQVIKTYLAQDKIMEAIAHGDRDEAKQGLMTLLKENGRFLSRVPNRRLRSAKNILFVANTVFRIAAERGNISPVVLDRISSHYSSTIEQMISLKGGNQLALEMVYQYCDVVAAQRHNRYSVKVNRALQFIYRHYRENLNLTDVARIAVAAPAYLSRRFKQETGETIFEFINRYRIRMARVYLRYQPKSVTDVALGVGFNDVTYFNRVFKRYVGMTPVTYMRSSEPTING